MTIIAGFRCQDGILLCADSQYTGYEKRYQEKIIHKDFREGRLWIAMTGDAAYARSTVVDCLEAIEKIPQGQQSISAVRTAIRRQLRRMSQEYNGLGLDPESKPAFLVAI